MAFTGHPTSGIVSAPFTRARRMSEVPSRNQTHSIHPWDAPPNTSDKENRKTEISLPPRHVSFLSNASQPSEFARKRKQRCNKKEAFRAFPQVSTITSELWDCSQVSYDADDESPRRVSRKRSRLSKGHPVSTLRPKKADPVFRTEFNSLEKGDATFTTNEIKGVNSPLDFLETPKISSPTVQSLSSTCADSSLDSGMEAQPRQKKPRLLPHSSVVNPNAAISKFTSRSHRIGKVHTALLSDEVMLQQFVSSLFVTEQAEAISSLWPSERPVCTWPGITCRYVSNKEKSPSSVSNEEEEKERGENTQNELPTTTFKNTSPRVVAMDWSHWGLHGTVALSRLPSYLQSFKAEGNFMEGELDLTRLPATLQMLWLSENSFSGEVVLSQLPTQLHFLQLSRNVLSGTVSLSGLPSTLELLDLSFNAFHGNALRMLYRAAKPQQYMHVNRIDLRGNAFEYTTEAHERCPSSILVV
eukprot:CAMPEP_0201478324 /NCGR_PEP_ID=MMETSP0151_2-20130828/3203_1 /ASSEMBLY_ACC=CAM_ASM_000257 /TAXON_ID=200890 /ORGANISM="Paramoeba atlantica, Strain 621/1 / CCAP 1560/9" /LENGTH=470 /DNA_ID=CAMNT_0047859377 /DNA_START=283 /DNA_END=1695 /DNA_ORIENTATION=+